jgi:uncharacterized protein with HEPN domain
MQRIDAVLALDIVLAAQRIQSHIGDMSREDFEQSLLHQDAVIRQCTIIGEAARNFSSEFRDKHPEIPWSNLIGFRNILVHAYHRVNLDTVWQTIHEYLPELVSTVEPLIPPEDPNEDGEDQP